MNPKSASGIKGSLEKNRSAVGGNHRGRSSNHKSTTNSTAKSKKDDSKAVASSTTTSVDKALKRKMRDTKKVPLFNTTSTNIDYHSPDDYSVSSEEEDDDPSDDYKIGE